MAVILLPALAFHAVLLLAAVLLMLAAGRARPAAAGQIRLAAVLYFAFAAAQIAAGAHGLPLLAQSANAIALLATALAPALLALGLRAGFGRPAPAYLAALLLVLACLCGVAAAVTGYAPFALAPLLVSALAILALALRLRRRGRTPAVYAGLGALALVAGVAGYLSGSASALSLFTAAGLIGIALALRLEAPV